jgi:hypothetical protein
VNILIGALLGAALGAVITAAGLGTALARNVLGRRVTMPNTGDIRAIEFYIGGFAVAGAFLGGTKTLRRTPLGTYVTFAIAGAAGMIILDVGATGSIAAVPMSDYPAMAAIGALFGCAAARGSLRTPTSR